MIPTAWARGRAAEAFADAKRPMDTELGLAFARILDREIQAANDRSYQFEPDEIPQERRA